MIEQKIYNIISSIDDMSCYDLVFQDKTDEIMKLIKEHNKQLLDRIEKDTSEMIQLIDIQEDSEFNQGRRGALELFLSTLNKYRVIPPTINK